MSVHLHRARQWTAWILSIAALSPFALCFASSDMSEVYLAPVSAHVTLNGRPAGHMTLCLDQGEEHCAFGTIGEDGTVHLNPFRWDEGRARPGHYQVHLFALPSGPYIPPKFREARTSGVSIGVASDWNDFQIDLR